MNRKWLVLAAVVSLVALATLVSAAPMVRPIPNSVVSDRASTWCPACAQYERIAYFAMPGKPGCVETVWYVDRNLSGTFDQLDTIAHIYNTCTPTGVAKKPFLRR